MFKKILIAFAVVVVLFLFVVALQPPQFRVERSLTISAPPPSIFPHVNDLHKADAWSPWLKMDPAATITYQGPVSGVGASSSWAGNDKIGEGRQTIIESHADELVRIKLEFIKPMQGVSMVDFTLKPEGAGTFVSWSIRGDKSFVEKAFCLFMNQDKMIGDQFEKGLADLKALVEAAEARK